MQQVILITGASSGLGKAMAGLLASRGHIVFGTSRKPSVENLPYKMLMMDVTDNESVARAIEAVIAESGKIDVLINNAGMGVGGALESFSDDEVSLQMETNFNGLARVVRFVLPHMRARKTGKIINVSSVGGIIGLPFQGFYSAAKFAIEGYSEALAQEIKPWNIRVVVINPGDFKTGFTGSRIVTRADAAGGDYHERVSKAVAKMGKDEQGGSDPANLARTVARIVDKTKPRYRYLVGRFDQRLITRIRHLLPPSLVRWIISDHYGI
jgi:NAD(P)-dependent dehydrogenase (short-subunit alcohol dehydrogenase family)